MRRSTGETADHIPRRWFVLIYSVAEPETQGAAGARNASKFLPGARAA
jgi:hypothetical protein